LLGGFLIAVGFGVLLSLLAGDVRRRRVEMRRKWYERRLHAAIDRVQAMKVEIEPPLDGVDGFAHAEVATPEPEAEEVPDFAALAANAAAERDQTSA